jgi:signal transduction histidine kinase
LINAIDALKSSDKADKTITILGKNIGSEIQISITDSGLGIDQDVQTHMFELLSTTKSSGMGIGLWLCKHIISRHGGSIWFESFARKGATFFVRLPLVAVYST